MHRILNTPIRAGTGQLLPGQPRTASPATGRLPRQAACDSARLGIRAHGRPMQPATLRVLETTWRVWREPLA